MKQKILKLMASLGVLAVLSLASSAYACSFDNEYNSEEANEQAVLQCHTYHAPEGGFIW